PGYGGYLDWTKAKTIYEAANDFLADKDYKSAIEKYREALKIYADYPQCLNNLAIALGKTGDYHAAELACTEAISIRSSDWKFWKTFAIDLYMQNKFHCSLSAMQQAMRLNPPVPDQAELIEDLEMVKDQLRKNHKLSQR